MNLTAVILTFRDNALYSVLLLAMALFALTFIVLHRYRRAALLSVLVALFGLLSASLGIYYLYGVKVASVELVTYRAPKD